MLSRTSLGAYPLGLWQKTDTHLSRTNRHELLIVTNLLEGVLLPARAMAKHELALVLREALAVTDGYLLQTVTSYGKARTCSCAP